MKYPKGVVVNNKNEDVVEFDSDGLVSEIKPSMDGDNKCFSTNLNHVLLEIRRSASSNPFNKKGFFLSAMFDWVIVVDEWNVLTLVPTKKVATNNT